MLQITLTLELSAPILRIVSYKQSKSSTHSHQEFMNLHYVPLAKSHIDQVHIDIKDEIGRSLPFHRIASYTGYSDCRSEEILTR